MDQKPIVVPGSSPVGRPPANDADALSREMTAARVAEFGDDESQLAETFPSLFFDYGDMSIDPRGIATPRGPKQCATVYGATRVAQVLGASAIVMDNPAIFGGLKGSFSDTLLVPWLIFSRNGQQGKPINGGMLLDYFNHGHPWQMALANAQAEVDGSFA